MKAFEELVQLMEDLSEAGYCAGWQADIEFRVWDLTTRARPARLGQREVSEEEIGRLMKLSEQIDGWVCYPYQGTSPLPGGTPAVEATRWSPSWVESMRLRLPVDTATTGLDRPALSTR